MNRLLVGAADRVGACSPSGSGTREYPLLPAPTAGSGEGSDRPPPG